jgi:hypothetical protein
MFICWELITPQSFIHMQRICSPNICSVKLNKGLGGVFGALVNLYITDEGALVRTSIPIGWESIHFNKILLNQYMVPYVIFKVEWAWYNQV